MAVYNALAAFSWQFKRLAPKIAFFLVQHVRLQTPQNAEAALLDIYMILSTKNAIHKLPVKGPASDVQMDLF